MRLENVEKILGEKAGGESRHSVDKAKNIRTKGDEREKKKSKFRKNKPDSILNQSLLQKEASDGRS